jgi:hypothetical protein
MNTPSPIPTACPDRAEHIDLAAAGWLEDADLAALRAHAAECTACRDALTAAQTLAADLAAAYAEPASVTLPRAPAPRRWHAQPGFWSAAAAVLLLAVLLPRREPPAPGPVPASPANTWLAYNRALGDPNVLDSLFSQHAAAIRFGKPEPVLMARLSMPNLEEIP